MRSICVYLGANSGNGELLTKAAASLGQLIAQRGIKLIYGGSSLGLMGVLASEVIKAGGEVTGIIPRKLLTMERPLNDIELIITDTMQERKLLLQQNADAFIVMPGGIGTLEEAFETWNAIKIGL